MVRFSLTICGLTVLFGAMSTAQQNSAPPQNRTAEGFSVQQARPTPSPRPGVVPGKISPNTPQATASRGPQAQRTVPAANQTGATAPKKNPGVAGAAAPAQTAPMGPPYPAPEIPQPSRPADMPPVPPQVTYKNGMLTVNALNSTMSSLLSAICSKTGIEFEGAENSSERVAINMGPAPEGEVLTGIFSGSSFDYVVLDRADSPGTVQRVILTPRGKPGATIAGPPQGQQPNAQQQADEENGDDADNQDQPDPQDTANQPPQVNQPPINQNQPETGGPKTPEQLLQELKQMQQQQQQQQGQPPPDTNSVP